MDQAYDAQLARDHSQLLDQQLGGFLASDAQGPTSFAGQLSTGQVNAYGSLDDGASRDANQPVLQRFVSNIGGLVPTGVQLEPKPLNLELIRRNPTQQCASAAYQQRAVRSAPQHDQRLHGWLNLEAGRQQGAAAQNTPTSQQQADGSGRPSSPAARAPAAAQQQQQVKAAAVPVPGNPLKIRLKFVNRGASREGSAEQRSTPPLHGSASTAAAAAAAAHQQQPHMLLESVRVLGADPLLSPIPAGWADVVRGQYCSAPPLQEPLQEPLPQPMTQPQHPAPAAAPVAIKQEQRCAAVAAPKRATAPPSREQHVPPAAPAPVAVAATRVEHPHRQQQPNASTSVHCSPASATQSPFAAAPAQQHGLAAEAAACQQPQPLGRQPSPPVGAPAGGSHGTKRPAASPPPAAPAMPRAVVVADVPPPLKRQRSVDGSAVATAVPSAAAPTAPAPRHRPLKRKGSGNLATAAADADAPGLTHAAAPRLPPLYTTADLSHSPRPEAASPVGAAGSTSVEASVPAGRAGSRGQSTNTIGVAAAPAAAARATAPPQAAPQPAAAAQQPLAPGPQPRGQFAGAATTGGAVASQQPEAAAAGTRQEVQPAVPGWAAEALSKRADSSSLGGVAALLPAVINQGSGASGLRSSGTVQSLQEEGKKLKKISEKKMRDGRPTHVSSMFLCQSCIKFLTVAATMEANPAKFSRENTSSMYSQTASLLDSCSHNASRAEGPAMITEAIALLAQRLAAVARLRSVYCLRAELPQQLTAFHSALEKASGETYQRPSPTDSNTSTSISVPLDPNGAAKHPGSSPGHAVALLPGRRGGAVVPPPLPPPRGSAAGTGATASHAQHGAASVAASVGVPLVGMPKPVLERQVEMGKHAGTLLQALSVFSKSGERLRAYMGQAAAQNSVPGLKVAAATLLLSADAGMGPAGTILSYAKDALDAVMQIQ